MDLPLICLPSLLTATDTPLISLGTLKAAILKTTREQLIEAESDECDPALIGPISD